MSQNDKDDLVELIQFKVKAEEREVELLEVIVDLRKDFLEVCTKYGEEANAYISYMLSLKYK